MLASRGGGGELGGGRMVKVIEMTKEGCNLSPDVTCPLRLEWNGVVFGASTGATFGRYSFCDFSIVLAVSACLTGYMLSIFPILLMS